MNGTLRFDTPRFKDELKALVGDNSGAGAWQRLWKEIGQKPKAKKRKKLSEPIFLSGDGKLTKKQRAAIVARVREMEAEAQAESDRIRKNNEAALMLMMML
jgi:hypothetical protein